jgi:hypothetical protein
MRQNMWFMQDVVPALYSECKAVFGILQCRSMHRMKCTSYMSSVMTPADFYLWGHLKGTVYSKRINTWDKFWCLSQVAATTIQYRPLIFQCNRNS